MDSQSTWPSQTKRSHNWPFLGVINLRWVRNHHLSKKNEAILKRCHPNCYVYFYFNIPSLIALNYSPYKIYRYTEWIRGKTNQQHTHRDVSTHSKYKRPLWEETFYFGMGSVGNGNANFHQDVQTLQSVGENWYCTEMNSKWGQDAIYLYDARKSPFLTKPGTQFTKEL